MNRKKILKATLIAGLFSLALGGWLLHLRIHPPSKDADLLIPFISGIVSVFCLPLLFWFRRTIALAYIINGFIAILGTIAMAHFAIIFFKGPMTAANIILNTTFADIAILWGKFFMGKALFDLDPVRNFDAQRSNVGISNGMEYLKSDIDTTTKGRFLRYPNMGWWLTHLFALATVYALGNIFWK